MLVCTMQDNDKKRRTIYLTDGLWKLVKDSAKKDRRSVTAQVEILLEKALGVFEEKNDND